MGAHSDDVTFRLQQDDRPGEVFDTLRTALAKLGVRVDFEAYNAESRSEVFRLRADNSALMTAKVCLDLLANHLGIDVWGQRDPATLDLLDTLRELESLIRVLRDDPEIVSPPAAKYTDSAESIRLMQPTNTPSELRDSFPESRRDTAHTNIDDRGWSGDIPLSPR